MKTAEAPVPEVGRYLLVDDAIDSQAVDALITSLRGAVDVVTFAQAAKLVASDSWSTVASRYEAVLVSTLGDSRAALKFLNDLGGALPVACLAVCNGSAELEVRALESGADDVVVTPVRPELLRARVRRVRKLAEHGRSFRLADVRTGAGVIEFAPMKLDLDRRTLEVDGRLVDVTPKEFGLLKYFMQQPLLCHSRDAILDSVWGIDFDTGTNMVDMYVYFVRKKLKSSGLTGVIRTVRGAGYRFVPPQEETVE